MRHTVVHRDGTNCQLKLKGQEAEIASDNVKIYYLAKMEHTGLLISC